MPVALKCIGAKKHEETEAGLASHAQVLQHADTRARQKVSHIFVCIKNDQFDQELWFGFVLFLDSYPACHLLMTQG